jgi:hypothetical protein
MDGVDPWIDTTPEHHSFITEFSAISGILLNHSHIPLTLSFASALMAIDMVTQGGSEQFFGLVSFEERLLHQ